MLSSILVKQTSTSHTITFTILRDPHTASISAEFPLSKRGYPVHALYSSCTTSSHPRYLPPILPTSVSFRFLAVLFPLLNRVLQPRPSASICRNPTRHDPSVLHKHSITTILPGKYIRAEQASHHVTADRPRDSSMAEPILSGLLK